MQTLSNFFANLSLDDPALWLALGAGLVVLLFFVFLGRRPSRALVVDAPSFSAFATYAEIGDNWEANKDMHPDERRRAVRRAGMPTAIYVLDPKQGRKARDAFVLDRSSGGVRMAIQKPLSTGSALQLKPHSSADDTPWVKVIVRNCREVGDYYEVGCQFDEELPWNVLLLFG